MTDFAIIETSYPFEIVGTERLLSIGDASRVIQAHVRTMLMSGPRVRNVDCPICDEIKGVSIVVLPADEPTKAWVAKCSCECYWAQAKGRMIPLL